MKNYFVLTLFMFGLLLVVSQSYTLNVRNLAETEQSNRVLEKEIYVYEKNSNYYAYQVYSNNGSIEVQIVDKDVKQYDFTFSKENKLEFRAAFKKFIILEEKSSQNKSVSYWVLVVAKTTESYQLQSFAVSSIKDDMDFLFEDSYLLSRVLEYNEEEQYLYVLMLAAGYDFDVYAIDVGKKGERLITIAWQYYNKTVSENIVGGNSRVLIDATYEQFLFDTKNVKMNVTDEPTIYNKVNISTLTSLPIYPKGSSSYSFLSSYFQYVSLSSDKLNLTTFAYQGYEETKTVLAEGSLNSTSTPIKIFSDEQSFFLAVADSGIYVSTLTWNVETSKYEFGSSGLSGLVSDQTERTKWLGIFNSVILVVYQKGRFFMLSKDSFYVISATQKYSKTLEVGITQESDLEVIMLSNIKLYMEIIQTR